MTDEQLLQTLTAYEAALEQAINEGGEEAEAELGEARAALMDLLKEARTASPKKWTPSVACLYCTHPENYPPGEVSRHVHTVIRPREDR